MMTNAGIQFELNHPLTSPQHVSHLQARSGTKIAPHESSIVRQHKSGHAYETAIGYLL